MNNSKKHLYCLILLGTLCTAFPVFTRSFFAVPEWIADFLKGMGVAIMFCALVVHRRNCGVAKKI